MIMTIIATALTTIAAFFALSFAGHYANERYLSLEKCADDYAYDRKSDMRLARIRICLYLLGLQRLPYILYILK